MTGKPLAIAGMMPVTLLDYPGKIAATVFLQGCDMACPFCHNSGLIPCHAGTPGPDGDSVLAYLWKRRNLLDGVVVSGGEPTLQDAAAFLQEIRNIGLLVKLDTNGLMPDRLSDWIGNGLVDYVAVDVKNSPGLYAATAGLPRVDVDRILESIRVLSGSGIPHEFRTTVVPGLHSPESIDDLCREFIPRDAAYWLQPFVCRDTVPDASLTEPSDRFLLECLAAARKHVPAAAIRGRDVETGQVRRRHKM